VLLAPTKRIQVLLKVSPADGIGAAEKRTSAVAALSHLIVDGIALSRQSSYNMITAIFISYWIWKWS